MTLKRYTLSVASPEDWTKIHGALIVDSNEDGIPDRKITCTDEKKVSPTRGTYELTEEEAEEIGKHHRVKWIELSLKDNPESFPKPQPVANRWSTAPKVYRDLSSQNVPSGSSAGSFGSLSNSSSLRLSSSSFLPLFLVPAIGLSVISSSSTLTNISGDEPPIHLSSTFKQKSPGDFKYASELGVVFE